MFDFGTPEDSARVWLEQAFSTTGPGVPDIHYTELEQEDLKNLFTYMRIAFFRASRGGASDEVMEVIIEWYDELFLYLLEALEGFRTLVCARIHQPILDKQKYYKLAGCGSAN